MDIPITGNRIVDLTFSFSLKIISYTEKLEEKRKFAIANCHGAGLQWVQISGKRKIQKVKQILFMNLKFLLKKQKKLNIGYYYVNTLIVIHLKRIYWYKLKKFRR